MTPTSITATSPADTRESPSRVSFADATRVWARIGLLGFGGPAAQIALMHKELVERRKWIGEARFLHALNYCMLLPGPEAQQLATYVGWLMHKTRGGLVAGTLFVLPGFLVMLGLSALYAVYRELPVVSALFFGLKAAVLAVVVEALLRIGKRSLRTRAMLVVAALAFVAIFFFDLPFPVVVLAAGLAGLMGSRLLQASFPGMTQLEARGEGLTVIDEIEASGGLDHTKPSLARAIRVLCTCVALWAAPIVALALAFGRHSVFVEEGIFFSKAAVVTFGGAYAVLSYIAQQAVDTYGWLRPGEMLDGLGLAETTPGPLIMVVEFVGFLGAHRRPGLLPPILAGVLGSAITVWVTFLPSFLWILLGAPYAEALRGNRTLHAALSSITAAVVGVVLNLSLWFALHVVFREVAVIQAGPLRLLLPDLSSTDPAAALLALAAMLAMFCLKLGLPTTLATCAALGAVWKLLA
jgi:chromate transporter